MPNADTFTVQPIGEFVRRYLSQSKVSVDPFARNKRWATHTNDLNPSTQAEHHMDATAFLQMLATNGVKADLVIFDPPYSPRQISECYKGVGREVGMKDTQSTFWSGVKDAIAPIVAPDGIVLSFCWNSNGMGKKHGFEIIEIMAVAHGGWHNDTICMAERKATRADGGASVQPDLPSMHHTSS
jgi:23S rRNA G2069 N7-methylase RlmK/C1962 C5-methylase RlmI